MHEADLEQLYVRLEKPIYNVVYRSVRSAEEAQEIVQEAFVRLWRMRGRVRPATVEPLVWRIAVNLARSRARRDRLWRWVSLEALREVPARTGGPEESLARNERAAGLRTAVAALPDELRDVILLCEFSEMTYDQIAQVLGIPAGTVGSRRNRALAKMRSGLGGRGADDRRAKTE